MLPTPDDGLGHESLEGTSIETVLSQWTHWRFPNQHVIVLTDTNFAEKNTPLWTRLSPEKRMILTKDIVLLFCNDSAEASNIIDHIDTSAATARAFLNGEVFASNSEEK